MEDPYRLTAHTALDAEVLVWGAPGRNTTWHTDPDCAVLAAHDGRVDIYGPAGDLDASLSSQRRNPRLPCVTCARPTLLTMGVNQAAAEPDQAVRLVLGCPHSRLTYDGDHHHCRSCERLGRLADGVGSCAYRDPRGYRLVALTMHRQVRHVAARDYAVHEVPAHVGAITADLLAVAWAARGSRPGAPAPLPAIRQSSKDLYHVLVPLNFTVADLITAPPA